MSAAMDAAPGSLASPFEPQAGAGWRRWQMAGATVWFKGRISGEPAARTSLAALLDAESMDADALGTWLSGLDGFFALAVSTATTVLLAVDRVRSTPLFYALDHGGALRAAAHAPTLVQSCGSLPLARDACLALAMSGYTIDTDTLHEGLQQLAPGEFVCAARSTGEQLRLMRRRYHAYEPWRVASPQSRDWPAEAAETTLAVLQKVLDRSDGRPLSLALSAGLDSRVIASGLHHLGACDVRCYAYGLPGNYEARASEAIAQKLGFRWTFVPLSRASQRDALYAEHTERYLDFADTRTATPVLNDLTVTRALLEQGYIDKDTVCLNGNSGDFISGMHIAPQLLQPRAPDRSAGEQRARIASALVGKHFRLWDALATAEHDEILQARVDRALCDAVDELLDPQAVHGLYEWMEFRDRQSKFVIGRQRIYEYLGLAWELPLWDGDYLDFWAAAPLLHKARQRLYREMAIAADWGGVWGADWWPRRVLSPAWMRVLVRPVLKACHAPLGREAWHRFERRFLMYWSDTLAWHGALPFSKVAADRRGARHFIAWHTERYLARLGLAYDGHAPGDVDRAS